MMDFYSSPTAPVFRSCGVQIPLSGVQMRNCVDINHTVPEHLRKYAEMRDENRDFDVTITIGRQRIQGHRALLNARIHLFKGSHEGEINLSQIDYATFKCLMDYAYTGHLTITGTNVEDLMRGAAALGMESVMEECARFMQSRMRVDNALALIHFYQSIGYNKIDNYIYRFVDRYFVPISETPEFLKIPIDELEVLLHRDSLKVDEEMDVFDAVTRWIEDDESRKYHSLRLLRCVRLAQIPEPFITDVIEKTEWVTSDSECVAFVEEARDSAHHLGKDEIKTKFETFKAGKMASNYVF